MNSKRIMPRASGLSCPLVLVGLTCPPVLAETFGIASAFRGTGAVAILSLTFLDVPVR